MLESITQHPPIQVQLDGSSSLTKAVIAQLNDACDQAEDVTPRTMVIVHMSGSREGRKVSTGPGATDLSLVGKWEKTLRRMERLDAPILVLAEHACSAWVLEILLASDHRIAAENFQIQFSSQSDCNWPGVAIHRFVHQEGIARARLAVLFGREIVAAEAVELHVIDEIATDIQSAATVFATSLSEAAFCDIGIRRRLLLEAPVTHYESALGTHLAACDRALRRMRS